MHSTVIQIEVTIIKEELFAHSLAKLHPSSHCAYRHCVKERERAERITIVRTALQLRRLQVDFSTNAIGELSDDSEIGSYESVSKGVVLSTPGIAQSAAQMLLMPT